MILKANEDDAWKREDEETEKKEAKQGNKDIWMQPGESMDD